MAGPDRDAEMLLAALSALQAIDVSDQAALDGFDRIAAAAKADGLTLQEAADQCGERMTTRILAIVLFGYLYHWHDRGRPALLTLAELDKDPKDDGHDADPETQVLEGVIAALQPLATEQTGQPTADQLAKAGRNMLSLARLLSSQNHPQPAADCAAASARLLRDAQAREASSAAQYALRLLDRVEKKAFLSLTPRTKYPPRPAAAIPRDVLKEFILAGVHKIFLDFLTQPEAANGGAISNLDEFNDVVRQMLADRDFVVHLPVQLEYQLPDADRVKTPVERLEMRFAPSLLRRIEAMLALPKAVAAQATFFNLLFDLLMQLASNAEEIEHRRDGYLHDWFVLSGVGPYREHSFYTNAVVLAQTLGRILLVTIGENEDDIDNWVKYGRYAETARDFLRRAQSALA